jgi:hypothetical protein
MLWVGPRLTDAEVELVAPAAPGPASEAAIEDEIKVWDSPVVASEIDPDESPRAADRLEKTLQTDNHQRGKPKPRDQVMAGLRPLQSQETLRSERGGAHRQVRPGSHLEGAPMNASPTLFDFADGKTSSKRYAETKRAEVLAEKRSDDDILIKQWRRWRQSEITQGLAGPHGEALAGLIAELKAATSWKAIDAKKLLDQWREADRDSQALVRRVVNAFVASKREAAKLPPFDDQIPRFEGGSL